MHGENLQYRVPRYIESLKPIKFYLIQIKSIKPCIYLTINRNMQKKNFKLNNFVKIFIGKYFKKQQTTNFDVKYIKLRITKCLHIK